MILTLGIARTPCLRHGPGSLGELSVHVNPLRGCKQASTWTTRWTPSRICAPSHNWRYDLLWRFCASMTAGAPAVNLPNDAEDASGEVVCFTVRPERAGERFDRVLSDMYTGQSRTYFQALIEEGLVHVNGQRLKAKSRKAAAGDSVEVEFVTPNRDLPIQGEDIPLDILYEDDHLVVINKRAGMVVHPAPGNWTGTLVHALCFRYANHLALGGSRPGIVHRLDKGTSGVIVCARTAEARRALMSMFAERLVEKTYLAVTVGNPAGEGCSSCVIDVPIGRSRTDRSRMAVLSVEDGGRTARSVFKVLASDSRRLLHLVQVSLETGRTHQIRVHLRHARAPILGDDVYGAFDINKRFRTSACRPMLHAQRLRFPHPVHGDNVDVIAPLPDDMRSMIRNIYPTVALEHPQW